MFLPEPFHRPSVLHCLRSPSEPRISSSPCETLKFPLQTDGLGARLISRGPALRTPPSRLRLRLRLPPAAQPTRLAALTFLTVLAFVAGGAHAGPIDARAVAPAGRVDALIHGHVALRAFPAAVALARPFRVLTVPTAQDGAGGCKTRDRAPGHGDQHPNGRVSLRRQSLPAGCLSFACKVPGRGLWPWRGRAIFKQTITTMVTTPTATPTTKRLLVTAPHHQLNAYYVPGIA